MPTEKMNKTEKKIYIWLFIIAFTVAFSSTYNPMNFRRMHVDSSVYVTISQGIIRGQLPYRDFVDNKGPFTYLLSVPGLFFGGFTGIWITELILMYVSVLFAYKIALFFGDKYKALLGTIFSFVALLVFFYLYVGTEEYSLPFLMISFFIFTKFYFSPKHDVNFGELIILGTCFSCAVLIRMNMFPLWAGFCTVIFIEEILKRRFIRLCKYISGFFIGIIIIFIPVFLYLKLNGIMDAFINQVLLAGTARGFSGGGLNATVKSFYFIISKNYSFFPLFTGLFFIIIKFKQMYFNYYVGYTFSYFLMLLFLSFSGSGSYYNLVLIPYYIPALVFLIDVLSSSFLDFKHQKVICFFFLMFCLFRRISKLSL